MQIRSQSEHHAAASELARLDVTRPGSEDRIAELVEAIDAWDCAVGAEHRSNSVTAGDRVQMAYAFPDRTGSGVYKIVSLMPHTVDGEPQYRIEGEDGRHRMISRNQIRRIMTDRDSQRPSSA